MIINFRRAVIEDIDKLIEVQNRGFYEDYIKYNECPAYNESREDMVSYINNCIVYVIECNCEIIGDIIIREIDEGNYYLRVLCIVLEFHNLGIGQRAVEFIEKDNHKVKKWELITPFESLRNHYFYEKMGYIKVGEYKHSEILTMFKYAKEIE